MDLSRGLLLVASFVLASTGGAAAANNYNPATISTTSGDVTATPVAPNAPYSQAALHCNVSGDSRLPAGSTFPLTVKVAKGNMVRVIFANGNLDGDTVTQNGEPGVIVTQNGAVIVQQLGSASPIVQNVGSPVFQQAASPSALIVQETPTRVQQSQYAEAPTVDQTPAASPSPSPNQSPSPSPSNSEAPSSHSIDVNIQPDVDLCNFLPLPLLPLPLPCNLKVNINLGRRLLQDTVPGGPNNGLVEYVALADSNSVPGFVVPNTEFGVPYVEFTATDDAVNQTATFNGALEVAQVDGGKVQYPFTPNAARSPGCQVNVNFQVA